MEMTDDFEYFWDSKCKLWKVDFWVVNLEETGAVREEIGAVPMDPNSFCSGGGKYCESEDGTTRIRKSARFSF